MLSEKSKSHKTADAYRKIRVPKYAQLSNTLFRYANCAVKRQRNKGNDKQGIQARGYLCRERRLGYGHNGNALFL